MKKINHRASELTSKYRGLGKSIKKLRDADGDKSDDVLKDIAEFTESEQLFLLKPIIVDFSKRVINTDVMIIGVINENKAYANSLDCDMGAFSLPEISKLLQIVLNREGYLMYIDTPYTLYDADRTLLEFVERHAFEPITYR